MNCAVLSIGTELTRGELVNTNSAWLAERLTDLGFVVVEATTVDDDAARITACLERLAETVSIVVCSGGLGPTTDDLTTETVARWLGRPLLRDEDSLRHIEDRFKRAGRNMSPSNLKQADFPEGARVLANPVGTAPGFSVERGACELFFTPGVPHEMKKMFEREIVPRIARLATKTSHIERVRTFGLPESVVGERLAGIEQAVPGIILGYRAHFPEIEVKVLASGSDSAEAASRCRAASEIVRERLADVIYGTAKDSFSGVVSERFRTEKKTLAIAESCTGGLIGQLLTRHAGASEFLIADVVAYANESKVSFLGVPQDLIETHGAVSEPVAIAMAAGMRERTKADVAISVTGIAGPSGGSDAKPVGTVFIGVASAKGTRVEHHVFRWEREQIQMIAAYVALRAAKNELVL